MLAKFSVKRPYTVVVAVILVLLLGTISFLNLETDLLPSIDLPYVLVMTSYPGASPEEVEIIVTKPLEQVMATVSHIKQISSVSSENRSSVLLEFNNDANMDSTTIEINGLVDLVKGAWPEGVSSPMLMRLNPDMLPIMIASVDIEGLDMVDISQRVEEDIIPKLESIPGLASVSATGLLEERIEILLEEGKIKALNKRLLQKVDRELAEAEDKLDEARAEIEEGLTKLEREEGRQKARLDQGQRALREGKIKLVEAKEELEAGESLLLEAEAELRKKEAELISQQKSLEAILALIEELEKNLGRQEADGSRTEDLALGLLDLLDRLPPGVDEALGASLPALRDWLEGGGLDGAGRPGLLASLREELTASLKLLEAGRQELDKGLEGLEEKKVELEEGKKTLDRQLDNLKEKEQDLAAGKILLTLEMGKARDQLTQGEKALDDQVQEFEKARDEALKKASLDGVISREMITGLLAAQNFSMPAGSLPGQDLLVKVGDRVRDQEELGALLLFDTGDQGIGKIFLEDVASIRKGDNADETYARVNGNAAVILSFQKQSNFSTAGVSQAIRDKALDLEGDIPGLSITALMDQGMYIDVVLDSVLKNVIYGGLLAILILLIFLKDIRPTFIIAVSIPISLIFAIAMMYFTGVTINIISLAGLALGVGMLVDNSIVVIENIYRMRLEGVEVMEASVQGAKEIAGAIISSTVTTASVFLPIVFVKGISRQIFTDMGLTIAYSLLASLIVALTLVPMLASRMLEKSKEKKSRLFLGFSRGYSRFLTWSLKHRALILLFVLAFAAFSLFLALSMGTSFMPDMNAPQMSMAVELDREATREELLEVTEEVIDRLMGLEEIKTIGAFEGGMMGGGMGAMGGGSAGGRRISLYLLLDPALPLNNKDLEGRILALMEDLEAEVSVRSSNMDMSALAGSGIEMMVKGEDLDTLQAIASDLGRILEEVEGTMEVNYGQEDRLTELRIRVDKEKAMARGLTVAQVYTQVSASLRQGQASSRLSADHRDFPVIVLDDRTRDLKKEELKGLEIKGKEKDEEVRIPLSEIADIEEGTGLASIRRDKQQRYLSVTAAIDADHNIGLVSRDFENRIKDYELPPGYRLEMAGENQVIRDSLEDLVYMVLLAIAFIYLIMVIQFQSLLSPFIVMFTIPLAFTGGLMALAIMGYEISVISMLGFLVLSGVVVNNGIVFIDYTNQLRHRGLSKREALVEAGRTRLRPILMTAMTTILGLSTLSMGVGMGSEMLQPLAIVSIGGLLYSTLLTLVVIPVIYDLLHRDKKEKSPSRQGPEEAEVPVEMNLA